MAAVSVRAFGSILAHAWLLVSLGGCLLIGYEQSSDESDSDSSMSDDDGDGDADASFRFDKRAGSG